MTKRIAIAGFQHETNTFSPHNAPLEEFERADAWPGLTRGSAVIEVFRDLNIPIGGMIQKAASANHDLVPILWCSAEPSSYVTAEAFETITDMLCEGLRQAGELDGVCLDLHGAMVAESFEDAEGEVLRRVREVIGPDCPLSVSLDLHANLTREMVEHADAIAIFRTYPHLDMAATGGRAYRMLGDLLAGQRLFKSYVQLPFLIPLSAQGSNEEPNKSLYASLGRLAGEGVTNIDFACGFPAADIAQCGPAVVAYGTDAAAVDLATATLSAAIEAAEPRYRNALLTVDEALDRASANATTKPVVIADVQDNPGAGGTSDTTGVLAAMVRKRTPGIIGLMHDPEVAAAAHAAGLGAFIDVALGGKCGTAGVEPFKARFEVEFLGDGHFECTGEMYRGSKTNLGPMARLRVADPDTAVQVLVGSVRFQCLDQAVFRHLGVEPTSARLLVVKSTVHFRADFDPIAAETLLVAAPGAHACRLLDVPYRHLRAGVRLEPMGPVFKPAA